MTDRLGEKYFQLKKDGIIYKIYKELLYINNNNKNDRKKTVKIENTNIKNPEILYGEVHVISLTSN